MVSFSHSTETNVEYLRFLAAYFVQNVVLSFEQHIATLSSHEENVEDKGKEASNLVVLLSELYNFQVISCVLIFDIIRTLLKNEVHESQVELLLKLVRSELLPFLLNKRY